MIVRHYINGSLIRRFEVDSVPRVGEFIRLDAEVALEITRVEYSLTAGSRYSDAVQCYSVVGRREFDPDFYQKYGYRPSRSTERAVPCSAGGSSGACDPVTVDAPGPDITRSLMERVEQMTEAGGLSAADADAIRAAHRYAREHHRTAADLPSFF